ncbi:MAG: TlpA family protein disulfide reductase [Pedobacter sp.]|nr:MAG: TlpA family protein disulfide reductase [Pedobacter sp.]
MKKTFIIFSLILIANYCWGQSIDATALGILQKSFDKLSALETINYRLTKTDTMIRQDNPLRIRSKQPTSKTVQGIIKKNAYWHLRFENNVEWLIRNDTLYKKEHVEPAAITFSADWKNNHSFEENSIYHLLGRKRPALSTNTASIQFVKNADEEDCYVIDIVSNKDYQSDETKSLLYFNRYWVNKKNLFCQRRMMYSKRLDDGKEAVDIYDFSVSQMEIGSSVFNPNHFFNVQPVMEKSDDIEDRKIEGTVVPNFSVTDVRTREILTLDQLKGKVVLLDFWYISCPPCRDLMPKIQQLRQRFPEKDLVVIGINVRDTSKKQVLKFLKEKKISYPQYYKSGTLKEDYKLRAFPTSLILDKDGKVIKVEIGYGEDTIANLEHAIRKELASPTSAKK